MSELEKLAMEIRSALGFAYCYAATSSDKQLRERMEAEFNEHRESFRRLGELLGVPNP